MLLVVYIICKSLVRFIINVFLHILHTSSETSIISLLSTRVRNALLQLSVAAARRLIRGWFLCVQSDQGLYDEYQTILHLFLFTSEKCESYSFLKAQDRDARH